MKKNVFPYRMLQIQKQQLAYVKAVAKLSFICGHWKGIFKVWLLEKMHKPKQTKVSSIQYTT